MPKMGLHSRKVFTRRRIWIGIFFGISCPVATVAIVWSAVYWQARRSLDVEIARIVARGEPLRLQELAPPHDERLRRGEELLALLKQVPKPTKLCRDMLDGEAQYSQDNIRKLREEVRANRDLVVRIVELTRDREIAFPVETHHPIPWEIPLPHVMRLRDVSTHLRAEVLDAELSADRDRAGQAISDNLDLIRLGLQDPILVGALVRCAHIQDAIDDLSIALCDGPLPEVSSRAIDDRLKRLSGEFVLAPAMRAERAIAFETLVRVGSDDIERHLKELQTEPTDGHAAAGAVGPLSASFCGSWLYRPRLLEQQAFALRAYAQMADLIDSPGPEGQLFFDEGLRSITDERRKHHLVSLQFANFDAVRTEGLRARQYINLGRLGIRIVDYAYAYGDLPASLADVSHSPSDSMAKGLFSGGGITYERQARGFTLSETIPGEVEPIAVFDLEYLSRWDTSGIVREDVRDANNRD